MLSNLPEAPELVDSRAGFQIWFYYSRLAACPRAVFGFFLSAAPSNALSL